MSAINVTVIVIIIIMLLLLLLLGHGLLLTMRSVSLPSARLVTHSCGTSDTNIELMKMAGMNEWMNEVCVMRATE